MPRDMLNRYLVRTVEHIHRVQKNMVFLLTEHSETFKLSTEQIRDIMYQVMVHDRSKFYLVQFEAYIELTEYYRQRNVLKNLNYDYRPEVREAVDLAVKDHYASENHHPEMYPMGSLGKWGIGNILECACDLQAMAQEFGDKSCRGYFENVWLPKYRKKSGFYDDFNWWEIETFMGKAIDCFESEGTNQA